MAVWRDPRGYLGAAVLGVSLLLLLNHLARGRSIGETYVVDIVAIGTLVAVVGLFLSCRSTERLARSQLLFLAGGLATWAISTILLVTRSTTTQPALMLVGTLLGLAILKPPSRRAAACAMDLLVGAVVVVAVIALVLEVSGVRSSWYAALDLGDLLTAERDLYWIPLADLLGIDGRWAGPFDHPGRSGQAGAIVLVWGITRTGWKRVAFVGSGVAMVLLAGSNTAYLSAAAGACVVAVAWGLRRLGPLPRWVLISLPILGVLALAAVVVGPNMGLTGRTSIWPAYVTLWQESPWTGAGASGIGQAISDGRLPSWAYHAHNSWLDLLARNGIVALAAGVTALVAAVVAAWGSAVRQQIAPLALIATLVVGSLAQPILAWTLPTVMIVTLVLAVLMSGPAPGSLSRERLRDSP